MSEQSEEKKLSRYDQHWVGIYGELVDRYQNLPPVQAMPYMAVRLLAMRYNFSSLVKALREKGTAWVAAQARHELTIRQQFIARMIVAFPPEDPEGIEGAAREMANDLAGIDCPEGGMRMLKYLDRLRSREIRFAPSSDTRH